MTKPAKVALALFVGIPLLLVILAAQRNHGHLMFTVKVQGQLFLPDRNSRRPRALVMVMPDRRWATDANLMRLVREEARDRE